MTLFSLVFPLTLLFSHFFSQQQQVPTYSQQAANVSPGQLPPELRARMERDRQLTLEINDLGGRIHSEADAGALLDKIAEIFADTLPPSWMTRGIRERLAHAEYASVSDPLRLIPESALATCGTNMFGRSALPTRRLSPSPNSTIYVTRISPPLNSCGRAAQMFGRFPVFMPLVLTAN
jgi:hypothetical protein